MRVRNASQSAAMHAYSLLGHSLRRCVDLSRRHLRNALFDALHQLSGTHYRKLFSVVTVAVFKLRLKTFLFSQAFSAH